MEQEPDTTEATPSDTPGADTPSQWPNPRSLANLRPPWAPGQSGNPSGLTKDGRPTKSVRRILEDKLNENEQRSLKTLVANWLKSANRGSAKHLEMILERIDPLELANAGRVVLEGLKLELTPGGGAQVTQLRSFAEGAQPESHGGAAAQEQPDVPPLLEGASGVPPSSLTAGTMGTPSDVSGVRGFVATSEVDGGVEARDRGGPRV